jgi:hypothetical protein
MRMKMKMKSDVECREINTLGILAVKLLNRERYESMIPDA